MSEDKEYIKKSQGFFVKIREGFYSGPYSTLNEARNEARSIGPDLEIYHGILIRLSEDIIDDSELFFIPKVKK